MKSFIVLAALAAVAFAAPQHYPEHYPEQQQVVLVKETPSDNIGIGGYNYAFEQSDGQSRHESAELVNVGTEHEALRVRGSFTWVDPVTNQVYTVNYIADENGFQPQGAHIPSI